MRTKNTAFYRGNKEVLVDFSAGEISSDGAVVLLEKLERKNKLIKYFSKFIPDNRDPNRIQHTVEKLLKQRVFMQVQGYEDTNDVDYLKKDPLFKDVLQGQTQREKDNLGLPDLHGRDWCRCSPHCAQSLRFGVLARGLRLGRPRDMFRPAGPPVVVLERCHEMGRHLGNDRGSSSDRPLVLLATN